MIHSSSDSLHFGQITTLLRRRWLVITTIVLLCSGLTLAAGFLLDPRYTAKAQILFEAQSQDGVMVVDEAAVETLVEMLISPNHIRRLTASLEEDPGPMREDTEGAESVEGGAQSTEETEETTATGSGEINGGIIPRALRPFMEVEAVRSIVEAQSAPPPIPTLDFETLNRGLNAYKERQSRLIAVTFQTTDPETSAIVANRAVDLYLDLEARFQRERRQYSIDLVGDRIPDARAAFDRAETALRAHQIQFGLSDGTGIDMTARQISELNRQLTTSRSDLIGLSDSWDQQSAAQTGGEERKTFVDGVAKPERAAAVASKCGPAGSCQAQAAQPAPDLVALDRVAVENRISDIERRLETLQSASSEENAAWTRLRELQHEAATAGQTYESLLRRQAELVSRSDVRPSARLITTASVPAAPSSPNPFLFVAPAIVVSLIIGGMIAALLERLDQRLRGERDVEVALGASCIGLVPKVSRRRIAELPQLLRDQPFAKFTEAIRGLFLATTWRSEKGVRPTTLLITSCAGGEGKTTLAVSLAIYAARLDRRVLVIDLDFRNPGVKDLLGPLENGHAAYQGDLPWETAAGGGVLTATQTGVDYLSLPQTGVDPISLLAGDAFSQFLDRLKQSYQYIVIDSGAVDVATETRLLASMVDRVILTARWGVTDARAGMAAMNHIQSMNADQSTPVGVVINQVKLGVHMRHRYSEPVRSSAPLRTSTA